MRRGPGPEPDAGPTPGPSPRLSRSRSRSRSRSPSPGRHVVAARGAGERLDRFDAQWVLGNSKSSAARLPINLVVVPPESRQAISPSRRSSAPRRFRPRRRHGRAWRGPRSQRCRTPGWQGPAVSAHRSGQLPRPSPSPSGGRAACAASSGGIAPGPSSANDSPKSS